MTRYKPPEAADTRAEPLPQPPLPDGRARDWAWFLDVDGTLLEIEQHPDLVSADRELLQLLDRLGDRYGGAVALISGRSLAQLERIFGPLSIAAAASHGLELRPLAAEVTLLADAVPDAALEAVAELAGRHPGLLMERQSYSVGVHYRARPELAREVIEGLEHIVAGLGDGFRLQHGKMMVELLPVAAGKGRAIRAFMQRSPFRGRRPVFVGDDVTDEHGFAAVNELGGLSVRVGDLPATSAQWRLGNVTELRAWLLKAIDAGGEGKTRE
jgi:trehalose 6-phosphate phosphatase